MQSTIFLSSLTLAILIVGCSDESNPQSKLSYLKNLEKDNHISYNKIINTEGNYITSMCYTKTRDEKSENISNPCYSCHTKGVVPNYYNDSDLQETYNFPEKMRKNPFSNLFKDRSAVVANISDNSILNYIRQSNYFDSMGAIDLEKRLPKDWEGYRPNCYYNFDDEGFDRDQNNSYTLWRAFRYYPFLGTFWPTNGSTDDVLIRLDKPFAQDEEGSINIEIYKLNLAIVESLVKQKDIQLSSQLDEKNYGVDLNQNGQLDKTEKITFTTYNKMSYIGMAKKYLEEGKIHLAGGLFPKNTEFLHSVRYIDVNQTSGTIKMAARMKELRYAKKYTWKNYSQLERIAQSERKEALINGTDISLVATFRGDYEHGMNNEMGWIYEGFIEDKNGELRPQTQEETINCMGCHAHLGVTTDSTFAFARKFEGTNKYEKAYGWNHWSQKGLEEIDEPKVNYLHEGMQYEYSFYLQNNHSGNEFRNNEEVQKKFFETNGSVKSEMINALHKEISLLLFPSVKRALQLNKGYKALVEEQSYIYGRDANIYPMKNVYHEIENSKDTGIERVIVR